MNKHLLWLVFHKDHAGLQFFKYLVCGGLGAMADLLAFYALALFVFPALGPDDILVQLLGASVPVAADTANISRNFIIASVGGFFVSGAVSYLLNIWFVFHSDASARHREIFLFLLVSAANIPLSTLVGWVVLQYSGMTTAGYAAKLVAALLINFIGRKHIVFRVVERMENP
jgi:putative flippase GtrA